MSFTNKFISRCHELLNQIDEEAVERVALEISKIREDGGRLFLIGSGGGAGHASHAACDFRKLCNIEAYAPYDNVSELTARVNDEGWDTTLSNWLKVTRFNKKDGLFVFSVGGGSKEKNVSMNLVNAIILAQEVGARVVGVVGKGNGFTAQTASACIVIPLVDENLVTPLAEGFQAVMWHLLVSHPILQVNPAKWESLQADAAPSMLS
jgi:D-sedoheptulose 7-phosphate isomerase